LTTFYGASKQVAVKSKHLIKVNDPQDKVIDFTNVDHYLPKILPNRTELSFLPCLP
jgi:hypothetical protein